MGRQLTWRVALHANRHGRRSAIELCRIFDAVETQPGKVQQPGNQLLCQCAFVLLNDAVGGDNRLAPATGFGIVMPPQIGEVVDGRNQSRQTLVILRAALPTVGQLFATSAQFVGTQALQLFSLAVKNSQVRPKNL